MKVFGSESIWSAIILALAFGVSPAQQQPHLNKQAIEARLFVAPSAPFKLAASSHGRGFEFCNYSPKRITKFRLGCVKQKDGELLINEKRDYLEDDLAPGQILFGNAVPGRPFMVSFRASSAGRVSSLSLKLNLPMVLNGSSSPD